MLLLVVPRHSCRQITPGARPRARARAADAHPPASPPSLHSQRMARPIEPPAEEKGVDAAVSDANRAAWQRMSSAAIVEVLASSATNLCADHPTAAETREMDDRARVAAAFAAYMDEL